MEDFECKIKLVGVIIEITYRNVSNGYTVLIIDTGSEEIVVTGILPELSSGEKIELVGGYYQHAVYGRQFKAESCTILMPKTADDLYRYLSSGVVKGIRESTARKIVDRFKEKSFDILENYPERLAEIKGISPEKALKIAKEYQRHCSERKMIMHLGRYGLNAQESLSAIKKLGNNVVEIIENNPYILCDGEKSISFEKAEEIAEKLPNKPNCEYRIQAAVQHLIKHNYNNGHTCLPVAKMIPPLVAFLNESAEKIEIAIDNMITSKKIVTEEIKDKIYVFLPEAFNSEKNIANRLKVLLRFPPENPIDVKTYIDSIEEKYNIRYADLQKEAIITAVNKGVLILTGGPGTGKTTTLNGIINMFEKDCLDIALCAPTGRAAQRMTEATGRTATTIHRLLEVEWGEDEHISFKRNMRNPLDCQVLIVDEMSMVDIFLFSRLLDALPLGCRLIMVGDSNQLPSVSPGNVLKDLTDSKLLPVVELKEIFRQSSQSNIVLNAHKIVNGNMIQTEYKDGDFYFMNRTFPADAVRTIKDLSSVRLPNAYGFDPLTQIQVLCPSKKGESGTVNLNKVLQETLNPPSPDKRELVFGYRIFREGDKIMQIRNNYNIHWESDSEDGDGIYNGDIGYIERIDIKRDVIVIDFSGKRATYSKEQLNEIEHAFAVTVHKSQGSEFDAVILPVLSVNSRLCYRNLLYTAVTRAKKLLVLVGTDSCVKSMIDNNKTQLRYSSLSHFLLDKES